MPKTNPSTRYAIVNIILIYLILCQTCTTCLPSAAKDTSLLLSDSEEELFSKFDDISDEMEEVLTPKADGKKYLNWANLKDVDGSYQDSTDVFNEAKLPIVPTFHDDALNMGHSSEGVNRTVILAAGTLDEFVTGKLGAAETGATLPYFLTEPESVYVVKNRPAVLKCKAAHALQVSANTHTHAYTHSIRDECYWKFVGVSAGNLLIYFFSSVSALTFSNVSLSLMTQLHFKCSGSSQPPPSTHDKHVDPHTGVHLEEVTATIHRDLVDEYFGKGPFKCECQAWSSRGVVKSQAAAVNIACKFN